MNATGPLRDYFLLEARHAPRRPATAMTIGAALVVLGTHALLSRLPADAIGFMEQAFRIEGTAAVFLMNDLLAVYFATYFVGLMGLLAATVTAREEDRLEILLAKPIRARVLLAARAWPVLLTAAASGAWLGPVTVAIALLLGALMIAVAGLVLERTDAR
jgi:hypothetical protein